MTRETPDNLMKRQVDGSALCCVVSVGDLIRSYGISTDDADVIFETVQSFMGDGQVMTSISTLAQDDSDCVKESKVIGMYEKTPSKFYETLEESLVNAGFMGVKSMMKYSKETADYLERTRVLKKRNMSQADAMALTIYTYDNSSDNFESNPYRMINKALSERNTRSLLGLRGYILRLLTALRKLPQYSGENTEGRKLYRAVTGISEKARTVGNVLSWPAFTSTSTDEDSVVDFFNNITDKKGEKYIIEIGGCFNKGHNIREFSFHPDEDGTFNLNTQQHTIHSFSL